MDNPVIIFGAQAIGRAAKEVFEGNGNVVYCFLDDDKKLHNTEIDTITVLGSTDDDGFLKLIGKKCEAFIASDDVKVRKSLVKMLNEVRHVQPVNAVHKTSIIATSASIGYGNFVDQGVKIGAGATVGQHCLIHSGAISGPEVVVGDYVQVGAGSVLNSGVIVEEEAFIGSGVIIVSGVTIGKGAR